MRGMPVSGLVITLAPRACAAGAALRALGAEPALALGPQRGRRLAATAETPSPEDDGDLFERVRKIPGVEHVDVVFVEVQGSGTDGGT
jgi:hypothetical protein